MKKQSQSIRFQNPLKELTGFEWCLWIASMCIVTAAYLLSPDRQYLTLIASLIGESSIIFTAKGHVLGQGLTVVFAVLYAVIAWQFRYYGEMLTWLCMTAPMAVAAILAWLRHPFADTAEVKVGTLSKQQGVLLTVLTVGVTVGFYFILQALGTANLLVSTISVATSFLTACLVCLRSPYYALGYACNDAVMIVLWILATVEELAYLPMIVCFVMFLLNDLYALLCWLRRKKQQAERIG